MIGTYFDTSNIKVKFVFIILYKEVHRFKMMRLLSLTSENNFFSHIIVSKQFVEKAEHWIYIRKIIRTLIPREFATITSAT